MTDEMVPVIIFVFAVIAALAALLVAMDIATSINERKEHDKIHRDFDEFRRTQNDYPMIYKKWGDEE